MKIKSILTVLHSISVGFYISLQPRFFSGMNPMLSIIFLAVFTGIFIWALILIFRESNKRLKLIQLLLLVSALCIGIYKAKTDMDLLNGERPKKYYQTETELRNK